MRPTVLPTPEIASLVATSERAKMAAVKEAELDIREDEEKRNQVANEELKKAAERRAKEAAKLGTNAPPDLDDKIDMNFTIPSTLTNQMTTTNQLPK
jgi:hypothetical protein